MVENGIGWKCERLKWPRLKLHRLKMYRAKCHVTIECELVIVTVCIISTYSTVYDFRFIFFLKLLKTSVIENLDLKIEETFSPL